MNITSRIGANEIIFFGLSAVLLYSFFDIGKHSRVW